jgi:hypothetical protein
VRCATRYRLRSARLDALDQVGLIDRPLLIPAVDGGRERGEHSQRHLIREASAARVVGGVPSTRLYFDRPRILLEQRRAFDVGLLFVGHEIADFGFLRRRAWAGLWSARLLGHRSSFTAVGEPAHDVTSGKGQPFIYQFFLCCARTSRRSSSCPASVVDVVGDDEIGIQGDAGPFSQRPKQ